MRAWELLGLDEGKSAAGSQRTDTGTSKALDKKQKPLKLKRISPIEPEGTFTLKTNRELAKRRNKHKKRLDF